MPVIPVRVASRVAKELSKKIYQHRYLHGSYFNKPTDQPSKKESVELPMCLKNYISIIKDLKVDL